MSVTSVQAAFALETSSVAEMAVVKVVTKRWFRILTRGELERLCRKNNLFAKVKLVNKGMLQTRRTGLQAHCGMRLHKHSSFL